MINENEHIDENYWDSTKNWAFVVMSFSKKEFTVLSQIVQHVAPRVKKLKEERKISTWHFRYGSRGADVSFRLRFVPEHRHEVHRVLETLAEELEHENLVKSHDTEKDPSWISNDRQMQEKYEFPGNWWWLIECDELLSEVAYRVMIHKDPSGKLGEVFHELLIMLGIQELGGLFVFKPSMWDKLNDILEDDSAKDLKDMHDFRKSNFASKQLEMKMKEYRKTSEKYAAASKEMIEGWRKEFEEIWDENWKRMNPMAIFFYRLL